MIFYLDKRQPKGTLVLETGQMFQRAGYRVKILNTINFSKSMFFRWIFKSAFAILIVSNTWNIVMGVFDATQSVVNQSSGVIIGETSIHFDRLIPGLEFQLESMTIGSLLSLWFQTLVVGLTMNILSICIFLVTYGRMIEIDNVQTSNKLSTRIGPEVCFILICGQTVIHPFEKKNQIMIRLHCLRVL